jgi:hypothetical protein
MHEGQSVFHNFSPFSLGHCPQRCPVFHSTPLSHPRGRRVCSIAPAHRTYFWLDVVPSTRVYDSRHAALLFLHSGVRRHSRPFALSLHHPECYISLFATLCHHDGSHIPFRTSDPKCKRTSTR